MRLLAQASRRFARGQSLRSRDGQFPGSRHEDDVAIRLESGSISEIISYRDRINSSFTAPTGYALEEATIGGKPLSPNAVTYLSPKILAIVEAVRSDEQASGELAVAKLVEAGATVHRGSSWNTWKVSYRGGSYTLWGCIDGKNKICGVTESNENGRWVDTTAEELIRGE